MRPEPPAPPSTLRRLLGAAAATATAVALLVAPQAQAAPDPAGGGAGASAAARAGTTYAGVWGSSLQGVHGTAPDATVRQIAKVSVDVTSVRVRFGNPHGDAPVRVREAWVGRPVADGSARLVPGSNHRLTFDGRRSVSIRPGGQAWSDPVPLRVAGGRDVAVSVYAPGSPVNDHTFPPFPADPPASYIGTGGNTAAEESDRSFPAYPVLPGDAPSTETGYHPGQTWWVDVVAGRAAARGALVTLGDSITDGYQAVGPPGRRWTDVLAERLRAVPARHRLSVVNAGISGNTVSRQPNPYDPTGQCCGEPAPVRLQRDVLSVPGVRTVMLLEGTNDIGGGENAEPAAARQVIGGMQEVVRRAEARGLRTVGATVLPMCNPAGSAKERVRLAVNRWIRTSGAFDAVVDFDRVLRDPEDPTVMREDLRHDCYHPNAAGDALLGAAVPLAALGVRGG
ncbi:GDSL-type esterase/lipase family protein [Vallicoccus soli]|uniref:SGNH hydrolase n=1 Tax=Vallicoccus soli TaxID=2339232 RepID=A0A3A3ZGB8_9ACTN|nr:GDSL-type esterase/lipase family protein [Vallicoccus soli]RJK94256.1 SGNH hydrolase [Vallicoccus soli]